MKLANPPEVKVLLDSKENISKVSSNAFEAWQVPTSELIGKSIFDVLYIEDITAAQHALLSASFIEEMTQFSARVVGPHNMLFPMAWTAQYSKVDQGMLLIAKPSASPAAATISDEVSNNNVPALFEGITVPLLLAAMDGTIVHTNSYLNRLMDADGANTMAGRNITEIFPLRENYSGPSQGMFNFYLTGERPMSIANLAGRQLPIKFALKESNVSGQQMLIGTITSMADGQSAGSSRAGMLEDFQGRTGKLLETVLEYFELTVEGYHGAVTDHAANRARILINETRQLMEYMEDMLETERLQSGKFELSLAQHNIMVTIKQALMLLLSDIRDKELSLELNGPDTEIMADEPLLLVVIKTLCTFAVKNSPRGAKVRIEIHNTDTTTKVEFIDRGPGLTPQEQATIFEAAVQPIFTGYRGAIGNFAAAKQIILKHNGNIGCISHEGAGSNFWFEIKNGAEGRT